MTKDQIGIIGSIITIVTGVGASVVLLVQLLRADSVPDFIIALYYLIATNLFLLIGAALLGLMLHSKENRMRTTEADSAALKERLRNTEKIFVNIACIVQSMSAKNAEISSYLSGIQVGMRNDHTLDFNTDALTERINRHIIFVLNCVCNVFSAFTDRKCSACIKLLNDHQLSDEISSATHTLQQHVWTHLRDENSEEGRKNINRQLPSYPYPYSSNTAFREVMNPNSPDDFYVNNDLTAAHREQKYINFNQHWPKYYNATAVAPIKEPGSPPGQGVIGFLCVDNKGGGFDTEFSKAMLMAVSCNLYFLYKAFWLINEHGTSGQDGQMYPADQARLKEHEGRSQAESKDV